MNKRIEDIFLQEKLTEIEPVNEQTDKIMGMLSAEKTKIWEEIIDINAKGAGLAHELMRLEHELIKLKRRFESKQFLFWDEIERKDERFETAAQREKIFGIKKDVDGRLAIVEFNMPKTKLGGIFIMPPPDELKQ